MIKLVTGVCLAVLVIAIYSGKCDAVEINLEHVVSNKLDNDGYNSVPESLQPIETTLALELQKKHAVPKKQLMNESLSIFLGKIDKILESEFFMTRRSTAPSLKRVLRQASSGYSPLYPTLPSAPSYNQVNPSGQYQPSFNQQWQSSSPYNNYGQSGYSNSFVPTNYSNPYNPSKPNNHSYGQYPSYDTVHQNNPPYNANNISPRPPYNQYPHSRNITNYQPNVNGYRTPNSTTGFYATLRPSYNQSTQNQYNKNFYPNYPTLTTGHRTVNTTFPNNPSHRPPYYSPGQNQFNNTYPSYPQYSPGKYPAIHNSTQRPPYIQPGKYPPYNNSKPSYWQGTNTSYSNIPSGRSPINVPYGQNPQNFNSYTNHYSTNTSYSNIPSGKPLYNAPNGQNAQNFNSYPNYYPGYNTNSSSPYNSSNQRPAFPPNNQFYSKNNFHNSYPQYNNTNTFRLAESINPGIPNQPPYSSPNGYAPNWNGTNYDPTKVSPEYFSYPH